MAHILWADQGSVDKQDDVVCPGSPVSATFTPYVF